MFTRLQRGFTVVLVIAMIMTTGVGAAFAQDSMITPGDGPGSAVQPAMGAVTIAPDTWQWYIFRSQLPINVDSDGNDVVTNPEDATIQAMLETEFSGIDFEVWSSDNLNNWINSSDFDPLGRGTENEFISGDPLFWKGSFTGNDNYYLIVQNRGATAATYDLDISGNVAFPSSMTLDAMMVDEIMLEDVMLDDVMAPSIIDVPVMSTGEMALSVDGPMVETTAGYGPENALMPAAGNVTIAPNTWQWYSFTSQLPVNVDSDGNDVVTNPEDATIRAALRTQFGSVNFEVWSRNDLNNWYNSTDFDPLGMGTENEFLSGDPLFWQGSFSGNDTYYLIVRNDSAESATYSLDISGHVVFPTAETLAVQ